MFEPLAPAPFDAVEEMFWNVEERFAGSLRGAVVLHADGWITRETLESALRRLQHRHPRLRALVERDGDGRLRFAFGSSPPPIPFHIEDCAGEDLPWQDRARRMLQQAFPPEGPFAAVAVLRHRAQNRSVLMLAVHHAIGDGLSALNIVTDLLTAYGDVEGRVGPPAVSRPVITGARARTGGWRKRLWLLRRFIRLQRQERRAPQTDIPHRAAASGQPQWVHWVFSRDETIGLVRRCRKEKASLNGALTAAMCGGLVEALDVPHGAFKCQLSFDIRAFLGGATGPVTEQDLGCFASIMNLIVEVPKGAAFWDLARRVQDDIRGFMDHDGPALYHNLTTSAAGRLTVRAAAMIPPPASERPALFVTHYGVLNMRGEYGSLRPTSCAVTFKNELIGPSLVVEGLVLGQRLNVGIAAANVDPAFWARLQDAVRAGLAAAAAR